MERGRRIAFGPATLARVEWDQRLFAFLDDLEGRAEALYDAERDLHLADRSRAEYRSVTLAGRLMASLGRAVRFDVLGVGLVEGEVQRVATDWCLAHGPTQDWMIRTAALVGVEGVSERAVPELAWSPLARLGLGSALRRLAEAGEPCVVHAVDGTARPVVLHRVGKDFAEALAGEGRTLLLRHDAIAAVQSRT